MTYEPREGVDYIIDFYQLVAVTQDTSSEEIKKVINERLREYHPDRLQGLATEFQTKGERMARLLNRAKIILLDEEKRTTYDEILTSWEGPVSHDGNAVIRIDAMLRAEALSMTPDELEAVFDKQVTDAVELFKYSPTQQALFKKLFEVADVDTREELRTAYDATLLAEDQVLSVQESERGRLIGLPVNKRYEVFLGYSDKVQIAIEAARADAEAEYTWRVLGCASVRLAILSGDTDIQTTGNEIAHTEQQTVVPPYFDDQAKRIIDIATKREEILEKRLEIFEPFYPVKELQKDAQPRVIVGVKVAEDYTWFTFSFDPDTLSLDNIELPSEVKDMLNQSDFESVYKSGYNVLSFTALEQIDLQTLLNEACTKHIQKFYPGLLDD